MWREIFARYAASGVSVLEFCRSEGISAAVFRRWRLRLRDHGKGSATPRAPAATEVQAPFIDIGAVAGSRSRFEVRLELGAGIILSIAGG
jgi:transposase-like protein